MLTGIGKHSDVRIRRAKVGEEESIKRLIRKVKIGNGNDVHVGDFIVAKSGDKIIGCAGVTNHKKSAAILTHLAVHPTRRKEGIGVALFGELVREVRRRKKRIAALCTMYYMFNYCKQFGFETCKRMSLPRSVRDFHQFTAKRYMKCAVMIRTF